MTMVTRAARETARAAKRKRANRTVPRLELRERIGQAAARLFKEHGFDSVSVDQIVAAAGVSKGTFFNFFPTKSDAIIVYYNELDGRLAKLRDDLDASKPLQALERFFSLSEELLRGEGVVVEDLMRALWSHPSLLAADLQSAASDRGGFAAFIARARACKTISAKVDPSVAADVIGNLWSSSVLKWVAEGRRADLAGSVVPKLRLLFSGLAPDLKQ